MEIRKDYTQFSPSLWFLCTSIFTERDWFHHRNLLIPKASFFFFPSTRHMYINVSNATCSCFWSFYFKFLFFSFFLSCCSSRMCKWLVPKYFMNTPWHQDPTWLPGLAVASTETSSIKTEDKNQSNYFVYPTVTKHTHTRTPTVELKANFSTTWTYSFAIATGLFHS